MITSAKEVLLPIMRLMLAYMLTKLMPQQLPTSAVERSTEDQMTMID
jgi:hypothetical protein